MNLPDLPRTTVLTIVPIPDAPPVALNVLDGQSVEAIDALMQEVLGENLNVSEQAELDDTLEALIPALVELRDLHGEPLNMMTVTEHANVSGFSRLAMDDRLSPLVRLNCQAMARRHAVYLNRALLRLRRAADDRDA